MTIPVVLDRATFDKLAEAYHQTRRELRNLKHTLATLERSGRGGYLPPARVRFRNDNAGTAPAFGVMRVTGGTAGQFVTIDQPSTAFKRRYLVNGPSDVATGKFGLGTWLTSNSLNIEGQQVLYASGTPAVDEEWGPSNGSWALSANRPGFLITGGNDTTALTTMAVQIITQQVFGKADAAIALNASGTVRVYGGPPGSESDTGQTISSVFNNVAAMADEAEVFVGWLHGKPYCSPATC